MTNPAYTHQAIISADAPPHSACGGSGRSVARPADVTCPDCLSLDAERSTRVAEAEVHDTPAIPAEDEPDHLAAFRALNPKPGQVFLDHSDRPLAVVEDHNGWYLTTLDGLNQFKPSAVGTFGPMTRARVVHAEAIVLDRPTAEATAALEMAVGARDVAHVLRPGADGYRGPAGEISINLGRGSSRLAFDHAITLAALVATAAREASK
jgi:hypothetical protein